MGSLQLGVACLGSLQLGVACLGLAGMPVGHVGHAAELPRDGAHSLLREGRESVDQLRRLRRLHREPRVDAGVSVCHHLVLGLGLGQLLPQLKLAFE